MSSRYKRKKQEKILLDLKNQIKETEKQIKYYNLYKAKDFSIKGLKVFGRTFQYAMPYVLSTSVVAATFILIKHIPFYRDDVKTTAMVGKQIDSLGNKKIEKEYKKEEKENVVSYITKYSLNNGNYERTITTYECPKLTEEEIINIINTNKDVKDILGDPLSTKIEVKESLSEEEMNTQDYLQAVIYNEDKNDFKIIKQDKNEDVLEISVFLLLVIIFSTPIAFFREAKGYDLGEYLGKILDESGDSISKSELKQILKVRKDNYQRMNGDNYER